MSPDVVWVGWLVLFLVYELYAARSKPSGDTLSEQVWHWFDTMPKRLLFSAFWVALGLHFVFGASVLPVVVFGAGIALVIVLHFLKEKR